MSQSFTIPDPAIGQPCHGYLVIAPVPQAVRDQISELQQQIQADFPDNNFWFPHDEQLHITFAHIITPNAPHGEESTVLWERIKSDAFRALQAAVPANLSINLALDTPTAYPAAVIVQGTDDGSFARMRQAFVGGLDLPPASRRPPEIIHATIARYYDALPLADVQASLSRHKFSATFTVTQFHIIHETELYAETFEVLDRMP